jgi:uncharacterized protein with von Willebrand factor type A (vWA) domain
MEMYEMNQRRTQFVALLQPFPPDEDMSEARSAIQVLTDADETNTIHSLYTLSETLGPLLDERVGI